MSRGATFCSNYFQCVAYFPLGLAFAEALGVQSNGSGSIETFGPYDSYEHLGHGGLTTVVRAIERETGRVVALKRLKTQFVADAEHIRHFLREARLAQALHHPNIVRVFDVGQVDGMHYMSMEWIPGHTLADILSDGGSQSRMPVGVALWILRQLLGALDYVMTGLDDSRRRLGIVHRDICPSNVILTPEGDVKVIDFGLAKSLSGRYATNSGIRKGNLGYMAPEVIAGTGAESRSDMYSVAILAWELLTSQRLFGGRSAEQLAKRKAHRYQPPSKLGFGISLEIDELLRIALSEDPCARWPSVAAMAGALDLVIRRYGRASGPEASMAWRKRQVGAPGRVGIPSAVSTARSNLGLMTTLPVSVDRTKRGIGRYGFAHDPKTEMDPVFDPHERHRLLAASED